MPNKIFVMYCCGPNIRGNRKNGQYQRGQKKQQLRDTDRAEYEEWLKQ